MPGSSASISTPNTILNTIVAEELKGFADRLEKAEDLNSEIHNVIKDTLKKHSRIIFNGNGYDQSWIKEAEKRGLSNYASTPQALSHYLDKKNVKVFTDNDVLTKAECESRYEIYLEKYYKTINIEARTMVDMLRKDILPSAVKYENDLCTLIEHKQKLKTNTANSYETKTLKKMNDLTNGIYKETEKMEKLLNDNKETDPLKKAFFYRDTIMPLMSSIRNKADQLELVCDRRYWAIPTYRELLFGVD